MPLEAGAGGPLHGTPAAISGRIADLWYAMDSGWLLRLDARTSPRPRTISLAYLPGRITAVAAEGALGVAVLDESQAMIVSMPDGGRADSWPLAGGGTVWPAAKHRLSLPLAWR